jgi:hypothetical protein
LEIRVQKFGRHAHFRFAYVQDELVGKRTISTVGAQSIFGHAEGHVGFVGALEFRAH